MQDTIAFGDSMNDYEMIKEAEVGVVYKDACEAFKILKSLIGNLCSPCLLNLKNLCNSKFSVACLLSKNFVTPAI